MARTGVGSAADEVFREAGGAGGNDPASEDGEVGDQGGTTGAATEQSGEGGSSELGRVAPEEETTIAVEGCNDQDKVARQLCEAATKEQDPFLRAALWDEYNEYKKIVARQ
jgi:hypothetical protein